MVKRATVSDVAKAAGVSVATVDRALTGRSKVRRDTAERIAAAASALGFHAAGLIAGRIEDKVIRRRVGLLLQTPQIPFYRGLARSLEEAVSSTRRFEGSAVVTHWERQDPDEIADRLRRLAARCDAVAMVSPDHPTVNDAVQQVVASGTPVFSLLSDFAVGARTAYLGVDNRKAGRTAAWAIAHGTQRVGKVVVFVGSQRFQGHELREIGFRSYLREHAPRLAVVDASATMESNEQAFRIAKDVFASHSDLVGCYVAGGGMEGVIAAVREARPDAKPVTVCSALTADSQSALLDGTVAMLVAEPVERICHALVRRIAATLGGGDPPVKDTDPLPLELLTSENI